MDRAGTQILHIESKESRMIQLNTLPILKYSRIIGYHWPYENIIYMRNAKRSTMLTLS